MVRRLVSVLGKSVISRKPVSVKFHSFEGACVRFPGSVHFRSKSFHSTYLSSKKGQAPIKNLKQELWSDVSSDGGVKRPAFCPPPPF